MTATAAGWLEQVDAADRAGEFLASYDLAMQGLVAHPGDLWLRHRAVLSLARSGATERARTLFREFGFSQRNEEDIAALGGRLAKDHALAVPEAERAAHAAVAAELYERAYLSRGYYSGINAATMWLLAGRRERARELAREVLEICAAPTGDGARDAYYRRATEAEAALLLADTAAARTALDDAVRLAGRDYAALATTRRQLRLICASEGLDAGVLAPLVAPAVVHYTGHMIGRLVPQHEDLVARRIRERLTARGAGFGYGALASGADILVAEALLDLGAELHVVLPCDDERFVQMSVAPAGREWVARFRRCREAARSVTHVSTDAEVTDDTALQYASAIAMGLAVIRGGYLDAPVEQVAVWDARPGAGPLVGTEADIARWRQSGRQTHVIDCPPATDPKAPGAPSASALPPRTVRAFLFGDVKGFSKLREAAIPPFIEGVMGVVAGALERHDDAVLDRNTWGDGLFVVVRDVAAAARCALELQESIAAIDRQALGLPPELALRVGAHAGPVFELRDPVLNRGGFFGSHVTRAARIEPITPEGEVYVTEAFAALLALEPRGDLRSEYVGHMPAAKGYGTMRMYVLKRAPRQRQAGAAGNTSASAARPKSPGI